jgi:predicted dehydrogenase
MLPIQFGNYLPQHFHGNPAQIAGLPQVRAALVGTGLWGYEHARALAANPHVQFVGLCGRTLSKAQARAAQFQVPAFDNIGRMIDATAPDLVCLSLPNLEHFPATMQVLRRGKAAFVEKPFVFDLHEGRQLLSAAEERGLFFAINFNHRYAEPFLQAKSLIETGELGRVVFASWRFGGNHDYPLEHPHCQLIETQCHGLDMLLHLVGPIASVQAEMTDLTGKRGYGTVVLALKFENGAVGSLVGSYDSSYAYPDAQRCEINGDCGRLVTHDTCRTLEFNRLDDAVSHVWRSSYFDDEARYFAGSHDRHLADVIRAFRMKEPPPIPAARGQEVLAVCYAAIQSFETGRRVEISAVRV